MASVFDYYAANTTKQHSIGAVRWWSHASMSHLLPSGPIQDLQTCTHHYLMTISSWTSRISEFSKPPGVWPTCAGACCRCFHLCRPEVSQSRCGIEPSRQTTRSGSRSSSVDVPWKGHHWSVCRSPHVQSPGCRWWMFSQLQRCWSLHLSQTWCPFLWRGRGHKCKWQFRKQPK